MEKICEENIKEIMENLIAECWSDDEFKKEFIKKPKRVIADHTGGKIQFDDKVDFVVNDQSSPKHYYLNIPRKLDIESLTLTDEELELASGGEIVASFAIGFAIGAAVVGITVAVANVRNAHVDPCEEICN